MVAGRDSTASPERPGYALSRRKHDGSLAPARVTGRDRGGRGARLGYCGGASPVSCGQDLGRPDGREPRLPARRGRRHRRGAWRGRRAGRCEREGVRSLPVVGLRSGARAHARRGGNGGARARTAARLGTVRRDGVAGRRRPRARSCLAFERALGSFGAPARRLGPRSRSGRLRRARCARARRIRRSVRGGALGRSRARGRGRRGGEARARRDGRKSRRARTRHGRARSRSLFALARGAHARRPRRHRRWNRPLGARLRATGRSRRAPRPARGRRARHRGSGAARRRLFRARDRKGAARGGTCRARPGCFRQLRSARSVAGTSQRADSRGRRHRPRSPERRGRRLAARRSLRRRSAAHVRRRRCPAARWSSPRCSARKRAPRPRPLGDGCVLRRRGAARARAVRAPGAPAGPGARRAPRTRGGARRSSRTFGAGAVIRRCCSRSARWRSDFCCWRSLPCSGCAERRRRAEQPAENARHRERVG